MLLALVFALTHVPATAGAADGNSPPIAVDDPSFGCAGDPGGPFGGSFPVEEDADLAGWFATGACSLGSNDSDPDGDALVTYELVTDAAHGDLTLQADGAWFYTPDSDYHTPPSQWLSDSFAYRVSDGTDWSGPAQVRIWIAPVNDAPSFTPASMRIEVQEDSGAYSAPWAANVSAGPLESYQNVAFEITTDDASAFAIPPAISPTGVLTFTPAPDTPWLSELSVVLKDDGGLEQYQGVQISPDDASDPVRLEIVVHAVDDAAVANDDSVTVAEDADATFVDVLANDADPDYGDHVTVSSVANPARGTAAVVPDGSGVTYRPDPDVQGQDSFSYTVTGGDTAEVLIAITNVNDPPSAVDDPGMAVPEGAGATVLPVLHNDTASPDDGETLSIVAVSQPSHGTATITGGGLGLAYRPAALFSGVDTFSYTVSDGHGGADTATVRVAVARDTAAPSVTAPTSWIRSSVALAGPTAISTGIQWAAADFGSGIAAYQVQHSVNSASFITVPLARPTATSVARSLSTTAAHQFRVRATDGEGNVSAWRYGPVIRPVLYQETTSLATWKGPWTSVSQTSASGGRVRYATSPTSAVTFRFNGRAVAFVAPRFTSSGRVRIYVDTVLATTRDLDTSRSAGQQVVFQRFFNASAAHTMTLEVFGDGRVDADAFAVLR